MNTYRSIHINPNTPPSCFHKVTNRDPTTDFRFFLFRILLFISRGPLKLLQRPLLGQIKSNLSLASIYSSNDVKLLSSEFVFCTLRTSEFDCRTPYIGEIIMILHISFINAYTQETSLQEKAKN